MIYNNVEFFGVGDLTESDGGVNWTRMPRDVFDALDEKSQRVLTFATGVELRFVIEDGESATFTVKSPNPNVYTEFRIFYGAVQGGWQTHTTEYLGNGLSRITVSRPKNTEAINRIAEGISDAWNSSVIRLIPSEAFKLMGVEGNVRPPRADETPDRTILFYGSSITHGSNAYTQPDSWAWQIAHAMDCDVINLGMAGTCKMEKCVIDYLASLKRDVSVIELGINVLGWEKEKAKSHARYAVERMAEGGAPVIVISPFYCGDDIWGRSAATKWRDAIEEVCLELSLPNVTYVSGLDLLGDASLLSADEVHPSIFGTRAIAERLLPIVKRVAQ